jgi:hypothetical protein
MYGDNGKGKGKREKVLEHLSYSFVRWFDSYDRVLLDKNVLGV